MPKSPAQLDREIAEALGSEKRNVLPAKYDFSRLICPKCKHYNALIAYPDGTFKCRDCGEVYRAK